MQNWQKQLSTYAIKPIQKFAYAKGKNSTDIALIIDAMDILHSKKVDGFCIVSSDSDFTGLANRIREDGLTVIGIGKKQTPKSFINACEIFTFTENFEKKNSSVKISKPDLKLIKKAFLMVEQENGEAYLSQVVQKIRELDSSFDPRTYGFKNYNKLFKSLTHDYQIRYQNNNSTILVSENEKV
ncbi:NYN domain-containing protein [Weeksellaceae bacterium KMM 9713]|uniref:NYN domain-containing protein n=1 Tax=Profundicola chukchiensis TaxID=2961959 RepID=A0A9X4MX24_9FLAO|nr:NYN domain-containing protein [Profundicola chukchiensis]MDG4945112.1 NYN domain-containing protein [Profundicola chukchiensis]